MMVIFIFEFVRVKMGGKIQTSLKLRSRRNASQKMSLRVKQIGFSDFAVKIEILPFLMIKGQVYKN